MHITMLYYCPSVDICIRQSHENEETIMLTDVMGMLEAESIPSRHGRPEPT